jgi:hypothetical protein
MNQFGSVWLGSPWPNMNQFDSAWLGSVRNAKLDTLSQDKLNAALFLASPGLDLI